MVVRLLSLGSVMLVLVSCANDVFTYNDVWRFRSIEEQQQTERRALAGDNDAADHLGFFYHFVQHNDVAAIRWFRLAAQRGDSTGRHMLRTLREQPHQPSNQAMQRTDGRSAF